ncbi:MAG: 4-hydroxythreonine-4-phosphate dehydrogenase PdxA [Bacteroidales bacterium]|nr:4-hydroxythreonine-4-phosphate dehydrogenase PdxA [Bacteroidales bacterium]
MTRSDHDEKVKIAITHGDFNGISYEIIIKALNDTRMLDLFTPVLYGLPKVMGYHRKNMKLNDFNYHVVDHAGQVAAQKVNVISMSNEELKIEFGQQSKTAGQMALKALEAAIADIKKGKVDVMVTAPINKAGIHSEEFPFAGHTEYLTQRFHADDSLMLLVADQLRVATVTNHIPVKEIAAQLTADLIFKKLSILNASLQKDFLIDRPKIAVLGLNPHAGDNGLIGSEEKEIIQKALDRAEKEGILAFGPFPTDGFFGMGAYRNYDAVLGMYHDQVLVPFKLMAVEKGVNYTAGLPYVRTSPDHGTAYEIAGKFEASEESMRQALYLAVDIFRNRQKWDEMNANPLAFGQEEKNNRYSASDSEVDSLAD